MRLLVRNPVTGERRLLPEESFLSWLRLQHDTVVVAPFDAVLDEGSSVDSPVLSPGLSPNAPLLPSSGSVPKADSLHGERCP